MTNREILQQRIDETLENLLSEIYDEQGIQTGDISPEQSINWENLTINFSTLFFELIEQNKA